MNPPTEPRQGWRHFYCEDCGKCWREATRDFKSPSLSTCPDCTAECHPTHGNLDESLPVDSMGNLQVVRVEYLKDKLIACAPEHASGISVGDKVRFVRVLRSGKSVSLRATDGVIEKFSQPLGTKALIKYAGGNRVWRLVKDLEPRGGPSPLNKLFKPQDNA